MNPARWLGPAAAGVWSFGLVYALALLAAGLRRSGALTHPMPHTGKLFHASRYRSLFRENELPSRPPGGIRQQE